MTVSERSADWVCVVERVRAVLVRKWHDDTTRDDPLAPWVQLDEVVSETGLSTFEALRALKTLQRSGARVLYEPADRSRDCRAKWVAVPERDGPSSFTAMTGPELDHVAAEPVSGRTERRA